MTETDILMAIADLSIAEPDEGKRILRGVLKRQGLKISRSGRGRDRGIDIIARSGDATIAIRSIFRSKKAGASDVQQVEGARVEVDADEVWMFSRSGFTTEAKECARKIGVVLHNPSTIVRNRRWPARKFAVLTA